MSQIAAESVTRPPTPVQQPRVLDWAELEEQLGALGSSGAAKVAAFVEVRRRFLRGQKLEMRDLSRELGIGRATLYRWFGNREWLLGEVLWSLGRLAIADAESRATGNGTARALQIYGSFLEHTAANVPLRRFVAGDPELALRVMTTNASPLQRNLVATNRALLATAFADERRRPSLPIDDLAYVMVRIGESFSWREFITGEQPDVGRAVDVVQVLLG
jgi:AcrR family transcriptional regulator